MSIYFLRHAKTYNNTNNILSGRSESDILPNQYITFYEKQTKFDVIYCSTSKRCVDTVRLLPNILLPDNIIFTDILLERCIGVLENITRTEAQSNFPEIFINEKLDIHKNIPGAESIDDVIKRVTPLVDSIMLQENNKDCLICSHNQTLKVINSVITGTPLTNQYWNKINFTNGSVIKIT